MLIELSAPGGFEKSKEFVRVFLLGGGFLLPLLLIQKIGEILVY